MNAFGAAINAIFADPNMSVPAAYRARGAVTTTPIRVIRSAPSAVTDWSRGSFVQASIIFDVRISELPNPLVNEEITVDGITYVIREEPLRDSEGLCWKLGMRDGTPV